MKNLSNLVSESFMNIKNSLMRQFGEDPGKMLLHTGTLGWILSSLAQVSAVVFNDKIPKKQKSFLIPQEIADGCVNIASFYLFTNSFTKFANKMVSTGKWRTPAIDAFLKKYNLKKHIGSVDFNIKELANFDEIRSAYKAIASGNAIAASTIGSIISCNIVTPILRNKFAADRQQKAIARIEQNETPRLCYPKGISLETFQRYAAAHSSNGMKI